MYSSERISKILLFFDWSVLLSGATDKFFVLGCIHMDFTRRCLVQNEKFLAICRYRVRRGLVQKPVFWGATKLLHYMKAPENCTTDLRRKWVGHTLVDETAVHTWRAGLWQADMLKFPDCQEAACIL